jgi:hypothetical protein
MNHVPTDQVNNAPTTVTWRITVSDLWYDHGWSVNGAWMREYELTVPGSTPPYTIIRRLKALAGIQGWRRDHWCGDDCWRNGCQGAWAELIQKRWGHRLTANNKDQSNELTDFQQAHQ